MAGVSVAHFFVQEIAAFVFYIVQCAFVTTVFFYQLDGAEAHGRLMDPPARNSEWRFGYPNPVNYNDNELFCGGRTVHWETNGGKCGVCGDAWNIPPPRPHEDGGKYANGIIVRRYTTGQDIDIEVELTSNHMGTFQFRLCPYNGNVEKLTQDCFDKHPLNLVSPNGNMSDIFHITHSKAQLKSDTYFLTARLPLFVSCTHCVIQWTYTAGNGWGSCENGTSATGCGPQETFVNCADVAITSNTGSGYGPSGHGVAGTAHRNYSYKNNPYLLYYKDYSKIGTPIIPLIIRSQVCIGTGLYRNIKGMENWCQKNCLRYPPSCPQDKCKCLKDCDAIAPFNQIPGSDQYCLDKCLVFPSKCPKDKCKCK